MVAVGNGGGRHEAQRMVDLAIEGLGSDLRSAVVSEAGASVYSVSSLAQEEYPGESPIPSPVLPSNIRAEYHSRLPLMCRGRGGISRSYLHRPPPGGSSVRAGQGSSPIPGGGYVSA